LKDQVASFGLRSLGFQKLEINQVLVRIAASGVNPIDTKIRAGKAAHAQQPLPAVLGLDMAESVEAVGSGVTGFRSGTKSMECWASSAYRRMTGDGWKPC